MNDYDLNRLLGLINQLEDAVQIEDDAVFFTITKEIASDNSFVEYIIENATRLIILQENMEESTVRRTLRVLLQSNDSANLFVLFLFYIETLRPVILDELQKGT